MCAINNYSLGLHCGVSIAYLEVSIACQMAIEHFLFCCRQMNIQKGKIKELSSS